MEKTMAEITAEYPEGKRNAEMSLVRMLSEKRSWVDYVEITNALDNIRRHAGSMDEERKLLASSGQTSEAIQESPHADEFIRQTHP